jgi:hypothetical protein
VFIAFTVSFQSLVWCVDRLELVYNFCDTKLDSFCNILSQVQALLCLNSVIKVSIKAGIKAAIQAALIPALITSSLKINYQQSLIKAALIDSLIKVYSNNKHMLHHPVP